MDQNSGKDRSGRAAVGRKKTVIQYSPIARLIYVIWTFNIHEDPTIFEKKCV